MQVNFFDAAAGNYRLFLDNNTSTTDGEYARAYAQASSIGSTTLNISITLKLALGESVLAYVWHNATSAQSANFGKFSSHRVY